MTKNNSSETKQILARELFDLLTVKSFQKITVNELCEKSMISRSTFYLHFQDKYQLLSYCLNELSKEWEILMKSHSKKEFINVILSSCREKEKIFFNVFENEINDELVDIFYDFFGRYITQCLEEKADRGALLPGPIDSLVSFYVGGLISMTVRWIKSNYEMPQEVLASCQYRLLKDIF